jgi:hypothetical protein
MAWKSGVLLVLGACSGPSNSSDADANDVDMSPDSVQGVPITVTLENQPTDVVAAKFFVAYQS